MEACYGGTDVMERSCAVARGIDINNFAALNHRADADVAPGRSTLFPAATAP
jgi:hypothetical protein